MGQEHAWVMHNELLCNLVYLEIISICTWKRRSIYGIWGRYCLWPCSTVLGYGPHKVRFTLRFSGLWGNLPHRPFWICVLLYNLV